MQVTSGPGRRKQMSRVSEILAKLIGFDTTSRNSNLELVSYVEDFLKDQGFCITRLPSPCGDKAGIYAERGPSGTGVLLSAHTDVVPTDGQVWSHDPFCLTREGNRLYGRGTTDMKGYIACVLAMTERAAVANLKEPLKILLSYDEEIGCVGLQEIWDQVVPLIGRPRVCFVGEPTEMSVAVGHKGKAAFRALCFGQSGHSAMAPNFVNALHLAGDFMAGLRKLQQEFAALGSTDTAYAIPYSTLHVGKLSGGSALNIVPDRAELTFECRYLASDKLEDIISRVQSTVDLAVAPYQQKWPEARIEISQFNAYPGLDVAAEHSVVSYALQLAGRNQTTKVAFGTEAGFFQQLGIPTVVCGPGCMEGQGHKADEYIEYDALMACEAMMERILKDLTEATARL